MLWFPQAPTVSSEKWSMLVWPVVSGTHALTFVNPSSFIQCVAYVGPVCLTLPPVAHVGFAADASLELPLASGWPDSG